MAPAAVVNVRRFNCSIDLTILYTISLQYNFTASKTFLILIRASKNKIRTNRWFNRIFRALHVVRFKFYEHNIAVYCTSRRTYIAVEAVETNERTSERTSE